jgi:hypothetical protein
MAHLDRRLIVAGSTFLSEKKRLPRDAYKYTADRRSQLMAIGEYVCTIRTSVSYDSIALSGAEFKSNPSLAFVTDLIYTLALMLSMARLAL